MEDRKVRKGRKEYKTMDKKQKRRKEINDKSKRR